MNIKPLESVTSQTVSEEDVREFEKEIGFQLPNDYREFLKANNGGAFEDHQVVWVEPLKDDVILQVLCALNIVPEERSLSLRFWWRERLGELKGKALLIGTNMGSTLVLDCNEESAGVYIHDRMLFHRKTTKRKNLHKVCDSFSEFLSMIKPYHEEKI